MYYAIIGYVESESTRRQVCEAPNLQAAVAMIKEEWADDFRRECVMGDDDPVTVRIIHIVESKSPVVFRAAP